MEQTFHSSVLRSKTMLTADVMILVFERPKNFDFIPGQFVQFEVPQPDKPVLRSYSIASHPKEMDLEFCTKIVPGGKASEYFVQLKVGDTVRFGGAKGAFVCARDACAQKVFIATGAGIAPIMSMIKDRFASADKTHVLFGLRNEKDLFWMERFEAFKAQNQSFTFDITLSQPSESWTGLKGWVSKHLPEVSGEASYYLCGSLEMVKDVRRLLLNSGVETKSVHFEIF